MTRHYPSQQDLADASKLERVMRDVYDRIYKVRSDGEDKIRTITRQINTVISSGGAAAGGGNSYAEGSSSNSYTANEFRGGDFSGDELAVDQLQLTTPVWDDTTDSAISLRDVGVNIPTLAEIGSTGIWLPLYILDDKQVFSVEFSHKMQLGDSITVYPHVHWIGETTDITNPVRWQLEYQWVNEEDDTIASSSTVITTDGYASALGLIRTDFSGITKSNHDVSSFFMGTLTRITNGATDYTGDVFLTSFDIHFPCDTMGSDGIAEKTYPSS